PAIPGPPAPTAAVLRLAAAPHDPPQPPRRAPARVTASLGITQLGRRPPRSDRSALLSGCSIRGVTGQGAGDEPAADPETIADWLVSRVDKRTGTARDRITEAIQQLGAVDRAVYQAIATTPTPALDEPLRRLSRAADKS